MYSGDYHYGRQTITDEDVKAVMEVMTSDYITQGPKSIEMEKVLGKYFGASNAMVVSNGTVSLHLIGRALGWKEGDVILTVPTTFLSSANCALFCGATPDFVDIDAKTYTMDPAALEEKVLQYRAKGRNVKAIVAVDFAGNPCNWDALKQLADKYEFQLVNDNCHALGAEYHGDKQYAVKYADMINLSFHPVKHITTGEGGAVLTNDSVSDAFMKRLRIHGVTKDVSLMEKCDGPWDYEMIDLGYNYRITDFQCALGISQMKRLDSFVAKRREIAKFYDEALGKDDRFIIPEMQKNGTHAYHLYPLQIKFDQLDLTKKEVFARFQEKKLFCQVHYIPVHLQPYYRKRFGYKQGDFPVAEQFYKNEISIPMYPALNEEDLIYIVDTIKNIVY